MFRGSWNLYRGARVKAHSGLLALETSVGGSAMNQQLQITALAVRLLHKSVHLLVALALVLLALFAAGCANNDGQLPKGFPADVPIISGEIYSARSTRFEDGKGYVVDVLTELSYEEVVAFYADVVGPRGNGYVSIETTSGDTPTRYVTIAVHLGR